MNYTEVEGDLIQLAKDANFDVIAHGCNCFCKQKSGIAFQMAKWFGTDEPMKFNRERKEYRGDINKLGNIESYSYFMKPNYKARLDVVNCYSQYRYGTNHPDGQRNPIDYQALQLCLRKINYTFKGKKIGLPKIGCGLAGGDWSVVKELIMAELTDCDVTVVIYNK